MSRDTASIAVCVATYGDYRHWAPLATRAMRSADCQTVRPAYVRWVHSLSLHTARNQAAHEAASLRAQADWLCFLDADDELDDRYIETMWDTVRDLSEPALVQPATLGVYANGREDPEPVLIPPKPLLDGNFMVIGTLVRYDQFHRVGGFQDFPCYEDWDLWIRCSRDGAKLLSCPEAIYRVHVSDVSRNNCGRDQQVATYNQIRSQYLR